MINYQEIIENLKEDSVKSLLDKLGIPYQDKGSFLLCKTGCHNIDIDEASWKLYFYKDTKLFVCYSNCGKMSIFKFLKHYYEERAIEYDWYEDIYQVVLDCSNFKEASFTFDKYKSVKELLVERKAPQLQTYPPSVLDCFVKTYPPEWLKEGISRAAMDKFNILYSISQNKIIIPHYDVNGSLIGIRGRALNEWEVENVGKYMPVQIEQTWYKHPLSLNLYGLNHTKDNIREKGICYLFESEKAVIQCESFSIPNCGVAVCGSQFNKYQLNLLMRECAPREIVICFDNEEKPGSDEYFKKLKAICDKYKNYCNFSFIYDRENITKKKNSPTDEGQEKFEQLLKRRVIVK